MVGRLFLVLLFSPLIIITLLLRPMVLRKALLISGSQQRPLQHGRPAAVLGSTVLTSHNYNAASASHGFTESIASFSKSTMPSPTTVIRQLFLVLLFSPLIIITLLLRPMVLWKALLISGSQQRPLQHGRAAVLWTSGSAVF